METPDFNTSFSVDKTPKEVFNAVNNVRGWWSERIDGVTSQLNDEFTYQRWETAQVYHEINRGGTRQKSSLAGT